MHKLNKNSPVAYISLHCIVFFSKYDEQKLIVNIHTLVHSFI